MPVRKIPIGNRAVTGQHARSGARYESSLERDFFELMMADNQVLGVEGQPVCINYINSQGKRRKYTPDALVSFKPDPLTGEIRPSLLCEVKYRDEYREKFLEMKDRIRAALGYARERGWQFRVVTDREIRTVRFTNLRFLAGFRDRYPDENHIDLILNGIKDTHTTTTAEALLFKLTSDVWKQAELIPALWWLLANSKILADLSVPITMQSPLFLSA
jgi:TnsA endonuclease N terminal/TnsA endonuclease C terminal